eukprot:CCRYP_003077-RA/>CCRYP_003077-RA protein AED:0.24 eAED:0.24 QI:0/-1/0/1/-1/0/1/0/160
MYIELPKGIETRHGSSKDHVLMLLSNLYGHKQAGRIWNSYLVEKLCSIGFQPSLIDECVFFRDDVIFIVYVDNGIFLGPNYQSLTNVICEISAAGQDIKNQGHPQRTTLESRSPSTAMDALSSPNVLSLLLSSMTSTSAMPTPNLCQLRLRSNYARSKTL